MSAAVSARPHRSLSPDRPHKVSQSSEPHRDTGTTSELSEWHKVRDITNVYLTPDKSEWLTALLFILTQCIAKSASLSSR